jgi:MFS family permease
VSNPVAHYARTILAFSRDARLFLLITILFGSAMSLYWTDFNLYVESTGQGGSTLGWLLAVSQLAGVAVALPASAISDRIGRRSVMVAGAALVTMALFAFLPGNLPLLFVGVAAMGAGTQIIGVVQVPFIAEHTLPEQRNEYFSVWQAIQFTTGFLATLVGGAAAQALAPHLGLTGSSAPYLVLLFGVALLSVISLGSLFMLASDRPVLADSPGERRPGRVGLVVHDPKLFFKLLLPGFLTALGAGQLIPFLNVFIEKKFNLDLAQTNAFFAIASLGTALAILAQPLVARRFGRIGSIVLVQGASIPFLVVLGFSPVLWTVIVALAVRNSLMNAGSPIFDAFAMDRVSPAERATLAAGMSMLWSLGWTIAPIYYGVLQDKLGFTNGYAVDFVTIICLYTAATSLLWIWFRRDETARAAAAGAAGAEELVAVPATPNLVTGEG